MHIVFRRHSRGNPLALVIVIVSTACTRASAPGEGAVAPATTPWPSADVRPGDTLPHRFTPRPTTTAITPTDLMSRVYAFADDSMQGRGAGRPGGEKAAEFLANELRRLGARPAGENGTFFQTVPLVRRGIDPAASSLSVDGTSLRLWTDFAAVRPQRIARRELNDVETIYAGRLSADTSTFPSRAQVAGKMVVFTLQRAPGEPATFPLVAFQTNQRLSGAAAVALVGFENASAPIVNFLRNPTFTLRSEPATPGTGPVTIYLTTEAATRILGAAPETLSPGAAGRRVRGAIALEEVAAPARNVIAIVPGTDQALANTYVALGAHSDHVAFRTPGVDHDSLRAVNAEVERRRVANGGRALTQAERATIVVNVDSLRQIRPARTDSVYNGADDDASGSMGLLEVAEWFVAPANRPKRSLLFVWHTAEELGLFGAQWYTDHPTLPRDSIVAMLNVDMIGRGMPTDLPEGKPGYVQLLGSRRLSTEFGDLVEEIALKRPEPFTLDYQFDAPGHPEQYYCRSDHYMYARYGIPVVFFSTGDHIDYHQITDEPQYINYGQLARVSMLLRDVASRVANLDRRLTIDKPKPDPRGQCVQ